jgi:excisionase family DNA binding protein
MEPDDVIADIYFNEEDECLVYSFYNPTNRNAITITATITEDIDGVYQKIASYPDDLNWRQHFIRRAMIKTGTGILEAPKELAHKYMTAKQVAVYLQLEEKTIRNMTSEGRIPFVRVGGAVRYEKDKIDEAIKNGILGKKEVQQKGKKKSLLDCVTIESYFIHN